MGEQLFVCFSFRNKQRSKVNLSLYGQSVLDRLLCLTIDLAEYSISFFATVMV
jgi:hypothetical protein